MSAGHAESHWHWASSSPKWGITTVFDCLASWIKVWASLAIGNILWFWWWGWWWHGHDHH
jgi:hypothetical protein